MSLIYIHYGNLQDSIERSQKARGEMSGYISELQRKIATPIGNLPGGDPQGYASTASSLAKRKINALNGKANRFSAYEASARALLSTAKSKDSYVSGEIESLASLYVQERKWYQKVGDWIYETFCVDLANKWGWVRGFVDIAKWATGKVGDLMEKVVTWFKYGDGKYVWNILTAVVGTVAAIGGAIAAICAIPFTGGATIPIVIGLIGAAAATVGAVITAVNSATSVLQNSKAIAKSGNLFNDDDGDPSAARYYGSQTTLSKYFDKTDMGDQAANNTAEAVGKAIDTTKTVADTTALVCSVASLGNVRDYRLKHGNANINTRYNGDKWYKGYSFTPDNIKRNIMHDMGFKVSSGKLDVKDAFNTHKSIFAKSYTVPKKFTLRWDTKSWEVNERLVKIFRGAKVTKNIMDVGKNLVTVNDFSRYRDTVPSWKDAGETVEAVTGLLGNMDFYKPFDDYGTKTGKTINGIVAAFVK